jgi:hypothetical protein
MPVKPKKLAPYHETLSMAGLREKYKGHVSDSEPIPKPLLAASNKFGKAALTLRRLIRQEGKGDVYALVAVFPARLAGVRSSKLADRSEALLTPEVEHRLETLSEAILRKHVLLIPVKGAEPRKIN